MKKRQRFPRALTALLLALTLIAGDAVTLFSAPTVQAVTQAELDALQKEADALSSQKNKVEKELSGLKTQRNTALKKKELLDKQIALTVSQIANAEKSIRQYQAAIEQTQREVEEAKQKEEAQSALFRARVRAMEERGTVSYWSVLFHSASFSDLLGALDFVSELMESDQRLLDELRALRAEIEEKEASLQNQLSAQETAKKSLESKNAELEKQREEANQLVEEMKRNVAEYQSVFDQLEREDEALQRKIVQMSQELAKKNGDTTVTYGGYIWPVSSHYVTSPIGGRYTGIKGASTNHRGIDIGRVYWNTQVRAAKAGTVIASTYNSSRGNYVVVSHGSGNTTLYQHLSSRAVNVGAVVAQGQVIGVTGDTGVGSGPHLHFEITENGNLVDPLKYLTDYIKGW